MTLPCDFTTSQSENCVQTDHRHCDPAQGFLKYEPPISLQGPGIKLSLLRTQTFQLVWPHCVLGTQTWANSIKNSRKANTGHEKTYHAIKVWTVSMKHLRMLDKTVLILEGEKEHFKNSLFLESQSSQEQHSLLTN